MVAAYLSSSFLMMFCMLCLFIDGDGAKIIAGLLLGVWLTMFAVIAYVENKKEKEKK